MGHEIGGRADKLGNRYESRWIIYELLQVIKEVNDSVTIEMIGDEEKGVDLWVQRKDGIREAQQCKSRNGSENFWTISDLKSRGILSNWKHQLDNNDKTKVCLVSPLACLGLEDLINRANNTTGRPSDFYEYQIKTSGKKTVKDYNEYCKAMQLNCEKEEDIQRSIYYLSHTKIKHVPDQMQLEILKEKIDMFFIGNTETVLGIFVKLINQDDIYSKKIDNRFLSEYFCKNGIQYREIAFDQRIIPRIETLNEEYEMSFRKINDNFFNRKVFIDCQEKISNEKSFVIIGKAGVGKSGCTESIICFCKENNIKYLAIKLDKKIPNNNIEMWSRELGFATSLVHCLNMITIDEKAVIILDQLDALRWTQANSGNALDVCYELIKQVRNVNQERKYKISVVFVSRSYDIQNDSNLKSLFEDRNELEWDKVIVNNLSDDELKEILGEKYNNLTSRMKGILRIPSNLYVWTKLSVESQSSLSNNPSELISEWWKQLKSKCDTNLFLDKFKNVFIKRLEEKGRLSLPIVIFRSEYSNEIEYLKHNDFLIVDKDISFVHQSVQDYFSVESMYEEFFCKNKAITEIIGGIEKQIPERRYQIQLLLQNILESDTKDFLEVGMLIIKSTEIRYYIKHIFYELLGQIEKNDQNIERFIIKYIENDCLQKYLLNNVVFGNKKNIDLLQEKGILDKWICDGREKLVANLFNSINCEYDKENIEFIRKYIFQSENMAKAFSGCFGFYIENMNEEIFYLMVQAYEKYPKIINLPHINGGELEKYNNDVKVSRYLKFILNQKNSDGYKDKIFKNIFYSLEKEINIVNNKEVIDILLPIVNTDLDYMIRYSDWGHHRDGNITPERICLEFLKKANSNLIQKDPKEFFEKYEFAMGKGYIVVNELLLDAFLQLPFEYSDYILRYLFEDIESNIMEYTSRYDSDLFYIKKILEKFSINCNNKTFAFVESKIVGYYSSNVKSIMELRIKDAKDRASNYLYDNLYYNIWGDLQIELLKVLPEKRLSKFTKELLKVIKRKFSKDGSSQFIRHFGEGGFVISPIDDKHLSDSNWINIICSGNDNKYKKIGQYKKGCVVKSSVSTFAVALGKETKKDPERFIKLIISLKERDIINEYVNAVFSSVCFGDNKISLDLFLELVFAFGYEKGSNRGFYIGNYLSHLKEVEYDLKIVELVRNLLKNIKLENICEEHSDKDFYSLLNLALNNHFGSVILSIANLVDCDLKYYNDFKPILEELISSKDAMIRVACLNVFCRIYNVDKEWIIEQSWKLLESEPALISDHGIAWLVCRIYESQYKRFVLKIVKNNFLFGSGMREEIASRIITYGYFYHDDFKEYFEEDINLPEEKIYVLAQTLRYYFHYEYKEKTKKVLLRYSRTKLNLENIMTNLFYSDNIDLEQDQDFIIDIINNCKCVKILHSFIHYLEKKGKKYIKYSNLIFSFADIVIEKWKNDDKYIGVELDISKLIISLYDEAKILDNNDIAMQCLNIWDLMFEYQIGSIRTLSKEIMER